MSKRFRETASEIKNIQSQELVRSKIAALSGLADGSVVPVPIELIERNKNIRHEAAGSDSPAFYQLLESIKEVGLLQHPVITVHHDRIVCIAGHRRLAALERLGQLKPPCILRHFDKIEKQDAARLLENTARKALNPLELADELVKLQALGYSQTRLQELLGKDRKTIGRYQKMSSWSEEAKMLIKQNGDKLKAGLLLSLASKTFLSDSELILALKNSLGDAKDKVKTLRLENRVELYFEQHQFSLKERELIRKVLSDLKLMKLRDNIEGKVSRELVHQAGTNQ